MSEVSIVPSGLYWIRMELPSFGIPDVKYEVLWLFSTYRFRYVACWPGYSWFAASGAWQYGMGRIHCRGRSHSFMDDFSENYDKLPYTVAFTISADGQALLSIGKSPQHYARLSPKLGGSFCTLNELNVPSRWQDFQQLMLDIERRIGLAQQV